MYLKRLEIQGFKSFADKINLEFNSGITSVVGPNGSGKSNVADAVRWVLGEQSAKTLRGTKMEDVIFAGTEHRKAMGLAEVSLTIDNSTHTLPIEFDEVTVTRRVYRSGESEYFINKTLCRLKDIHELFLDTGIGKDGYSIIGQGRVDEILSTKSEERRHIFEEASGIMKYKVRKQEAEKKLDLTEQNLVRINDIISELETQLEPLKAQSETAKKYLSYRDSLKELEINVYIDNIAKFKEKIKEHEEQYLKIKESIDNENLNLENITRQNKEKTDRMKAMEEALEITRQEFYNIENNLEKCSSEIKLNDEKTNNFNQNIERLDLEVLEINEKKEQLNKDETIKNQKIDYLSKQLEEYSQKLSEHESKMASLNETLDENERYIENLKDSIMDKLDLLSDKKSQIGNIKIHVENLKKRQHSIDMEIYQITLDKDRELIKKEDIQENINKAKAAIDKARAEINGLTEQKKECETALSDLRRKHNEVVNDYQFKSSRHKMLQDMENKLEGYNRSVKVVLQACQQSKEFGHGIHGALAQLITVDKRYETAIEMTLGGALQNIVTSTEEDAKRAIEYLKKNKLGRATFLPITSVKGRYLDNHILNEVKNQQGFIGVASDLIRCNSEFNGIILNLLGKVVVVENLDAGIRIAKRFGYSFRIVTLEGDILSTSGSMSGGSTDNAGPGILSRNREITELKTEISKLAAIQQSLDTKINEAANMLQEILTDISNEEKNINTNELVKMRDESHLAQIEETIKKADAKADMLRDEKAQLIKQESDTDIELQKYNKELLDIENDINNTKEIISKHQEKYKEDQSLRDNLHNDIMNFKISVNSVMESLEAVKETLARIIEERQHLEKSFNRKSGEKEKYLTEIDNLKAENTGLSKRVKALEEEKTGKVFSIDKTVEEKKVLEEELSDTINQIQNTNKNIILLQEDYNRVEVKKAKVEAELEVIQNRMWDEYELTFTNAMEFKKDIGSIPQAQKRINEIKNDIKALGPVNIAAIEEYIKTKERYEFMSGQRNDMEQAKEKLKKVISEMISIMKRQFLEQFKLINDNFNIVFRELFEGGRAELILVDMENVLESGIEIEVQPPGKKLQNMMLLSGGERAFTAIALLFSILRLRPTPFCILDEIEAALDDANVYRFAEYLKRYTINTQFIMVTHRKGTMEAANTLYGVTMQEHGVSKIVSMRMGEKAS
ncbi:chromosome segregation protein SMC [Pseudobacteroides cellulosolvens]|uniref:chromosome segregation protein SMC n=1 Tax=Pseudobacteroides cellulosolvens TaxID=35825 RepID=UPI00056111E5|nr:chromosome segregation protein SMC [Pseudobacteroides cellulosolvens]